MDKERIDFLEKFFKKASVVVKIDKSDAVEVTFSKGVFTIDVKNPLALMGLGLDLDMLKSKDNKKSVIRKAIKDMGFKIKLRYKFFEIDL
jgi:hypothetical protein